MELIYGNKYVCNTEEVNDDIIITDSSMLTITLDFLDAVQEQYCDKYRDLPEDWHDSIFWNRGM